MSKALSDRSVLNLKTDKPQEDVRDAGCPGLVLRVTRFGKKTWTFIYTSPRSKERVRLTLGTYHPSGGVSLSDARARAAAARKAVEEGKDPRDEDDVDAGPNSKTIAMLVDDYLEHGTAGLRSVRDITRRLKNAVVPVVGDVPVSKFRVAHANKVTDPIKARGKTREPNIVFSNMSGMFTWAIRRDVYGLERNPLIGVPAPCENGDPRDRFLQEDEIKLIWDRLPKANILKQSGLIPDILMLCLVTGQRLSQVCGMRKSELLLADDLWILSVDRNKNKILHSVPLYSLALKIIHKRLKAIGDGDLLFPCDGGDKPIEHRDVEKALRFAHERGEFGPPPMPWTERWKPHDLRRTFGTHCEELGFSEFEVACVLNQVSVTKKGVTGKVYMKAKDPHLKTKRAVLEKWNTFLSGLVAGDNVVPLVRAA